MRADDLMAIIARDCDERSPAFGRGVRLRVRLPGQPRLRPAPDLIPVNVRHDRARGLLVIETASVCCDLHGRNCEPPGELCCEECSEAGCGHFFGTDEWHQDGTKCVNPDLSRRAREV